MREGFWVGIGVSGITWMCIAYAEFWASEGKETNGTLNELVFDGTVEGRDYGAGQEGEHQYS